MTITYSSFPAVLCLDDQWSWSHLLDQYATNHQHSSLYWYLIAISCFLTFMWLMSSSLDLLLVSLLFVAEVNPYFLFLIQIFVQHKICKFGKISPVVLEIQGDEISDFMVLVNNLCVSRIFLPTNIQPYVLIYMVLPRVKERRVSYCRIVCTNT